MIKYVAGVEYVGSAYSGWQKQKHVSSVQACVEAALSKIANETIGSFCSGRTDAGVHAKEQVIHFESESIRSDYAWRMGANTHLARDIRVLWCHPVADDFHARFSATARTYRYVIYNSAQDSALLKDRVNWVRQPLDAERMHIAAQDCLGEQDFSSFRASGCQSNTPFRNVHDVSVKRQDNFVVVEITANAFLHHMVRNIVGSLLEIGLGQQSVDWMADLLAEKDRDKAGMTALACGLYFIRPSYPEHYQIRQRPVFKDILY